MPLSDLLAGKSDFLLMGHLSLSILQYSDLNTNNYYTVYHVCCIVTCIQLESFHILKVYSLRSGLNLVHFKVFQ